MRDDGRDYRQRQREFRARPVMADRLFVEFYEDMPNGEANKHRAKAYFIPPPTDPETDPEDIEASEVIVIVSDPLREFTASSGDRCWVQRWGKWLVPESDALALVPCELAEALAANGTANAKALDPKNAWQPGGLNQQVKDVFRTATATGKRGLWRRMAGSRIFIPVEC